MCSSDLIHYALDRLLADKKSIETDLPAQGVVTLTHQASHARDIVHLLYASPVRRGDGIEIIEDLVPLYDVAVRVRAKSSVEAVQLVPQGSELPFKVAGDWVEFTVPRMVCHQMVSLLQNPAV